MKTLVAAVVIAIFVGGAIGGYFMFRPAPAGGSIEISFRINDPLRYPDDEPLEDPQTVVWLEDTGGNYVRSLLVSDWTAMGGWKKKVKLPDGRKVTEICPEWQTASNWPKNHSKKMIDTVTKATPETGDHKISMTCSELNLPAGTYRYHVQTSVAELHTIIATGELTVGAEPTESVAKIAYKPGLHKDAGAVLSDVKARYSP